MIHITLATALILATPLSAGSEGTPLNPSGPPAAMRGTLDLDLSLPDLFGSSEPDREINGCIVPGRPDWVWQMDPTTTNERALANAMYQHRWSAAVVENQDCGCALRYPDWHEVIEEFQSNYDGMDPQEMFKIIMAYRSKFHQVVSRADSICSEKTQ
ncbi:hypothetical protein [Roseinatronobacter alkalisoli]|uniref:Uncharacterized protein n=1 Tax=Roseinatronobacter alkalisoli TaxID=3028235 RepID=A0ABT5TA66_9RHOB|nr:hypothetical protein [Roseinatronobacter sp. HJB301]MDD7972010.1 hypothetical protein [Roseinatronobacter sp. HJB301]